MATVPEKVAETELSAQLQQVLPLLARGKVRDTYALPEFPDKLLVVASDRISIFDFVLGSLVPMKGEVLTALTVFWLTELFDKNNHLVSYGSGISQFLPAWKWRDLAPLYRRAIVVDRLTMYPVECIARGNLTGSGWKAYQQDGAVCGIPLPPGLIDGSKLEHPIFTPTTKAEVGHDEHITAESVNERYGEELGRATIDLFTRGREYAEANGVIIADTKFEFGVRPDGSLTLGDEVLTPDSSRFWDIGEYMEAQKKARSPSGYDKEPVRQAGKKAIIGGETVDISKLDPTNPEHVRLAASWEVPKEVIESTTARYLAITERLTGRTLQQFQADSLCI